MRSGNRKELTTGEVAKHCGVAPRTVTKWTDSRRLKAYKLPGSGDRRIVQGDLIDFLREYQMPVPVELLPAEVLIYGNCLKEAKGTAVDAYTLGILCGRANVGCVAFCDSCGIAHAESTASRVRTELPDTVLVFVVSEDQTGYKSPVGLWDKVFVRPCNWSQVNFYIEVATKMSPEKAQQMCDRGASFGDVFDQVPVEFREAFKEWWLTNPNVPNKAAREKTGKVPVLAGLGFTGSVCPNCQGSRMVRRGSCECCEDCGSSSSCG